METAGEMQQARDLVAHAVKVGLIVRPSVCESCGDSPEPIQTSRGPRAAISLHHHDYAKPYDVIPLCAWCHVDVHCGVRPEPRTGRIYPGMAAAARRAHNERVARMPILGAPARDAS